MSSDDNQDLKALSAVLSKLRKVEEQIEPPVFSKEEVASLKRIMLTEQEAAALRQGIQFMMGASAMMALLKWIKGAAMLLGTFVAAYLAFKSGATDYLRSLLK